jgi:hypothetical protein
MIVQKWGGGMVRKSYRLFLACLVVASCALAKTELTPDKWDALPTEWRSAVAWECAPQSEPPGMQVIIYPREKRICSGTLGGVDTLIIEGDIDKFIYDKRSEKLDVIEKALPNSKGYQWWSIEISAGASTNTIQSARYGTSVYRYRCFPQPNPVIKYGRPADRYCGRPIPSLK